MKKKIRFIPFILAVLLLFTACAATGNSQRGKELGYFNYPGLDWGMTEAEFFKAMNKVQEEFTVTDNDDPLVREYVLTNQKFLDEAAEIAWRFHKIDKDSGWFLTGVTITYLGEKDVNAMIEKLNAFVKNQEVSVTDGTLQRRRFEGENVKAVFDDEVLYADGVTAVWVTYNLESKATVSDLKEELRISAEKGYDKVLTGSGLLLSFEDRYGDIGLSTANIQYVRDMSETEDQATLVLTLDGTIGWIDAYVDFAE